MPSLILDANTALFLKQLGTMQGGPLWTAEVLFAKGVRVVVTSKVLGEQVEMSLSEHHRRWRVANSLAVERTSRNETNEIRNGPVRRLPVPNEEDIPLIALTRRLSGVLYCHDAAATGWARKWNLVVVDTVDIAAFAAHRGWASWDEIEVGHSGIDKRKGLPKPVDWTGTVAKTSAERPHDDLFARLDAWLDASPVE